MNFIKILSEVPIGIVLVVFIASTIYCLVKYLDTAKNLNILIQFLSSFKKNDLNFRFKELDTWMMANPYFVSVWSEFKNTLVFSESVALKTQGNVKYQDISSTVQNVQTTVDPLYFFNEETLINSKFNSKLIQTIPTILTGFGPLFTFLNIAIAFGQIDFSTQEKTLASVSGFLVSSSKSQLIKPVRET